MDRTADAGVVNVANMDLNIDPKAVYPLPAAKVIDLQIIGMSYENETVTLSGYLWETTKNRRQLGEVSIRSVLKRLDLP